MSPRSYHLVETRLEHGFALQVIKLKETFLNYKNKNQIESKVLEKRQDHKMII